MYVSEENEKLFGDHKIPSKVMIKRLWHYLRPELSSFIVAFILIIFNGITRNYLLNFNNYAPLLHSIILASYLHQP